MRQVGNQFVVPRRFVVEAEPLPFVADRVNAGRHIDKTARALRCARRLPMRVIDRIGRILREGVQDVGEQQFLVLLLVMQADLQDREHAHGIGHRHLGDQPFDRGIDVSAIAGDVGGIRPRDQPALRAGVARTGGNVIGVEQKRKAFVEDFVARIVRYQQELLEKPGDVRAMPFGRRGIGHRLHDLVLGRQMRGTRLRFRAHAAEGIAPTLARVIRRFRRGTRRDGGAARSVRHGGARH